MLRTRPRQAVRAVEQIEVAVVLESWSVERKMHGAKRPSDLPFRNQAELSLISRLYKFSEPRRLTALMTS
jgi:hypothetical protein